MFRLIGVIWILGCGAAMFWALGRMRRAGRMPVRGINGPRGTVKILSHFTTTP